MPSNENRTALDDQFENAVTKALCFALNVVRLIVRKQLKAVKQQFIRDFHGLYDGRSDLPARAVPLSLFLDEGLNACSPFFELQKDMSRTQRRC